MIDKRDLDAYLNIKAPNSIKERLQSQINENDRRNSKLSLSFYALAASLIIIATAMLFIPTTHAELYFDGSEIKEAVIVSSAPSKAYARTVDSSLDATLEIPLDIKVNGKSEVRVSAGEIRTPDSNDAQKSIWVKREESIIWTIPPHLTENATITIEKGNKLLVYSISQSNETGKTVLKKVK